LYTSGTAAAEVATLRPEAAKRCMKDKHTIQHVSHLLTAAPPSVGTGHVLVSRVCGRSALHA
jgi:hypothetical protein